MTIGARLSTRVGIAFSALFLSTLVGVLIVTIVVTTRWVETAVDDSLASVAEEAAHRIAAGTLTPIEVVDQLSSASQFVEYRTAFLALEAGPAVLGGRVVPVPGSAFRPGETVLATTTMSRSRVRVLVRPVDADDGARGYIVVASPIPGVGPNTRELALLVAGAGLVGLLVTIAATWLLSRWIAQPLTALAEQVRATAASGFRQEIAPPVEGTVEVREVGAAVNELIDRQREQIARERAFLADSSHVLRTPLAVMRGNMDLLEGASTAEERAEAMQHVRAAIATMSRTVGGLLLLARDEVNVDAWQIVDLSRLCSALVDEARGAAPALTLTAEVVNGLEVGGDPHQLRDLLGGLLENATRYTPEGGAVVLRARPGPGATVVVEVADTGIGLSEEEARRATERFFRGYRARRLFPGGTGIGLSIGARIAEIHGGRLTLEPGETRGATARLILPRLEHDPPEA